MRLKTSAAIALLLMPILCMGEASREIAVTEIRVLDKGGRGVKSKIFEVTREKKELLIDDTDANGVLLRRFKCPQWHKVVAKPVAGRFTESPHTACATKLVLTVWSIDTFPEATVRIVVPFGVGGTADAVARALAQQLQEAWKQEVIVENKPGGGGNVGTANVAGATPDGYTLLMGLSQNFTIYPNLYTKLPYDPRIDFSPITMVAAIPNVLVAPPSSPTRSVKDVIERAKANPGKLNFASIGIASESHLSIAQFGTLTGTRIQHVPYAGSGPAVMSLMSGKVDFAFNSLPSVLENIKSGKIKALAVSGPKRAAALPEVPTMSEAGVAGYDTNIWLGLFAPAGTPEQLIRKLESHVTPRLKDRKLADLLISQGIDPIGSTSDQFAALISRDASKWAAVIKAAGVKPQ